MVPSRSKAAMQYCRGFLTLSIRQRLYTCRLGPWWLSRIANEILFCVLGFFLLLWTVSMEGDESNASEFNFKYADQQMYEAGGNNKIVEIRSQINVLLPQTWKEDNIKFLKSLDATYMCKRGYLIHYSEDWVSWKSFILQKRLAFGCGEVVNPYLHWTQGLWKRKPKGCKILLSTSNEQATTIVVCFVSVKVLYYFQEKRTHLCDLCRWNKGRFQSLFLLTRYRCMKPAKGMWIVQHGLKYNTSSNPVGTDLKDMVSFA